MLTLARDSSAATTQILILVAVFAGLMLAGGFMILMLRRRLLTKEDAAQDTGLFDALKQMRDSGEMSKEEYEVARKRMVTKAAEKLKSGKATKRASGGGQ